MFDIAKNSVARTAQRLSRYVPRRFLRHEEGATAVEFGLLAAPFLAMVFAIMETGLVFFAGQVLETATANGARLIMTGQAQNGALTPDMFRDKICNSSYGLFTCDQLQVETKSYNSFSSADMSKTPTNGFGGANCVVVLRVSYQWPVFVDYMSMMNAGDLGGHRQIVATSAFRNEPFGGAGSC